MVGQSTGLKLAVVGLLIASACGGSGPGASGSSGPVSTQAAGGSPIELGQGVTADTIKIGTSLPLTGGAATSGQAFQTGLQKAVDEQNKAGGIGGRKIELTVLDDGFTADRSAANIRRLNESDKVFAIVCPGGTSNLPSSWPYLTGKGIPVFGPTQPPDPNMDNVYNLFMSLQSQQRVMVDYVAGLGVKTMGYIGSDNVEGATRKTGVLDQAAKDGLTITDTETVEARTTNVSAAVLAAKAKNPQVLMVGTENSALVVILKQLQQLDWHPIVVGDASNAGTGGANVTGPAGSAADGLLGTLITELPSSSNPAVDTWRKLGNPTAAANFDLLCYATAKVFFEIVKRMGNNLTWPAFQSTAEGMQAYETGILPPISFGKLPGGHTGVQGSKIAKFDMKANDWQTVSTAWIVPKN